MKRSFIVCGIMMLSLAASTVSLASESQNIETHVDVEAFTPILLQTTQHPEAKFFNQSSAQVEALGGRQTGIDTVITMLPPIMSFMPNEQLTELFLTSSLVRRASNLKLSWISESAISITMHSPGGEPSMVTMLVHDDPKLVNSEQSHILFGKMLFAMDPFWWFDNGDGIPGTASERDYFDLLGQLMPMSLADLVPVRTEPVEIELIWVGRPGPNGFGHTFHTGAMSALVNFAEVLSTT